MHGFARLRLVGTLPIDGVEECSFDDAPKPLPFPACVRDLPVGGRGGAESNMFDALGALEQVSLSFEKLRQELDGNHTPNPSHGGPRAA